MSESDNCWMSWSRMESEMEWNLEVWSEENVSINSEELLIWMRWCNWSSRIERILANFRSVARVSKARSCWLYSWERLERMDSNTSRFSIKREHAADKSPFARFASIARHLSYTERYLEMEASKIEVLSRRFWITWRWFSKSPRCLLRSNYKE